MDYVTPNQARHDRPGNPSAEVSPGEEDSPNYQSTTPTHPVGPSGTVHDDATLLTHCPTQHACVSTAEEHPPVITRLSHDRMRDVTTGAGLRPNDAAAESSPQERAPYITAKYGEEKANDLLEEMTRQPQSPPPGRAADIMDSMYSAPQHPAAYMQEQSAQHRHWPFPAPHMEQQAAALYDAAITAAVAGANPPRVDQTTGLATQAWELEATGHPADDTVLSGIKHGFSIQYRGPPLLAPAAKYNHQSAINFADHVDAYIQKELAHGAISGPYSEPPFTPWFVSSPIMSREKSGGDGRRIIVDLSFPDGGINQFIAPHIFDGRDAVHNLPTIQSAVATLAATPPGDIRLSVIDLSRAYRQFPVTPLDWPLLGIYWDGAWSFDCRIPFGCRMSSFAMQTIAEFLVRALAKRAVKAHMYLDDIIVVSPTPEVAERDYKRTLALLADLGLMVAHHKLQPPSPVVTWLGIRIDVDENVLSIPGEKLTQIKDCMALAAGRDFISKKHLQRLIGLANHLSKVIRAARTFICRLLAALRAATTELIRVTRDVRADLRWYALYVSAHNCRAIIPHDRIMIRIWADACLKGAGASDGRRYYEHQFTSVFSASHHITQLEALNCLAAVRVFVNEDHAGGTAEVMCDNRAAVDAYTSGRARDPVLAAAARALWYHAAHVGVDLRFTHTPGEAMALPDALSRASLDASGRARADAYITKLSLTRVRSRGRDFDYKQFT